MPKIKLSSESTELIREFAKKLQLNKLYKFDKPDVQTFHVTAIASKIILKTEFFMFNIQAMQR